MALLRSIILRTTLTGVTPVVSEGPYHCVLGDSKDYKGTQVDVYVVAVVSYYDYR
jgi:hypothetical protein